MPKPHVTACLLGSHRLLVLGRPDPNDESHDCDAMGCSSVGSHVLERISAIEAAQELYRLRERVEKMTAELLTSEEAIVRRIASAVSLVQDEYQRKLDAPPVVPKGWEVVKRDQGEWSLFAMSSGELHYCVARSFRGSVECSSLVSAPLQALRALGWAVEHDQRPPHEGETCSA